MRVLKSSAVLAVLVSTAAVSAHAAVADLDPVRTASATRLAVGPVDYRDPAQVQRVYVRLQRAAIAVCGSPAGIDRATREADRACAEQALKQAIAQVDRPLLTALHQQSGGPVLARGY